MRMREERLRARESYDLEEGGKPRPAHGVMKTNTINSKSFRYMRRQPTIVQYDPEDLQDAAAANATNGLNNNSSSKDPGASSSSSVNFNEIPMSSSGVHRRKLQQSTSIVESNMAEDGPGKKMQLKKPLEVYIDGPFGAPSSNIFRAEHAVLIGTGIGVTPFASILQSIMHRYWQVKRQCPQCLYQWSDEISSIFNLKKVRPQDKWL